jgi:hypothetical protein
MASLLGRSFWEKFNKLWKRIFPLLMFDKKCKKLQTLMQKLVKIAHNFFTSPPTPQQSWENKYSK